MKRILQISNNAYPHIGGIEHVVRGVVHALKDIDVEQKVICFNEDAAADGYVCHRRETIHETVEDVEIIRCGYFVKASSQPVSATFPSELKNVLKSFDPDIVIFHYPNPYQSTFLLPLLKKETKLVVYWHLDITKQKFLGKLFHGQNLRLLCRADKIVATSPNYIDGSPYLSQFREKCTVIPSFVDPERFAMTAKMEGRVKAIRERYSGKILCFVVGRHVPYKGLTHLIAASRRLDDRFRILIAGQGPLTEQLKAEAAGDDKVEFLGCISDDEVVAYDLACDVFCFPSITKNEAFGTALAEGMYCAKPAVTFTIPGSGVNYVNLNGITGIECPNGDSKAYAEALVKLAGDEKLRKEYGEAARIRVIKNFTAEQFQSKLISLLKDSES